MPEIILPQRWTKQPQYPVEIDWSNPITRGLVVVGNYALPTYEPVSKSFVSNTRARGAGPRGRNVTGTTGWASYPNSALIQSATGNGQARSCFFLFATTTTGNTVIAEKGSNQNFVCQTLSNKFTFRTSGSGSESISSVTNINTGTPFAVLATSRNAGINTAFNSLYVDGKLEASASKTDSDTDNTDPLVVGARVGDVAPFPGDIYCAYFWNRELSDVEAREICQYPWQVFVKQTRRIFFDVVAGGGTAITGTLGTASAIGYQASVSQDTNIAATIGTAVAEGYQAAVATGTQIACAIGTAVAEGFQSAVATSTVIACALGTADATGYQAAVDTAGSTTIVCATGTADASGFTASVAQETVIACAIGTATALGRTATVSVAGSGTGATAAEIWAYEIEPGVTAKVAMQRILAVLGGKVSGAGSGTETFRDINDTRDALVSVNDSSGNRTSLTWTDGA